MLPPRCCWGLRSVAQHPLGRLKQWLYLVGRCYRTIWICLGSMVRQKCCGPLILGDMRNYPRLILYYGIRKVLTPLPSPDMHIHIFIYIHRLDIYIHMIWLCKFYISISELFLIYMGKLITFNFKSYVFHGLVTYKLEFVTIVVSSTVLARVGGPKCQFFIYHLSQSNIVIAPIRYCVELIEFNSYLTQLRSGDLSDL